MTDFVLGDEGCEIHDVVETLFQTRATTGLIDNWKTIARDLRVPPIKVNQLEVKRRNDEPIQEIWFLMLDAWVGVRGNDAKLSVLIDILGKPNYSARDAADKLHGRFFGNART